MKINIKSVAEKAGFSTATVSRVLRNYPGVRGKTRKKVLKAVSELNYEVNAVARSLRQKKTYSIGIIVGNVLSQFYSVIAKSVEDTANKYGYNVILCNGDEDSEKELNYLKILKSNRVDGIILTPTGKNPTYIQHLINSGTKVVLLDRLLEGVNCDAVLVDNAIGAYKAVRHLIEKGYRKIGIVNGYLDRTTGTERLEGYLNALREAGIAKDNSLIKIGNFKKESGRKLTKELLNQSNKPEAIFTTNIDMSIGALVAIKDMNLKIPEDIGIVCFDDSDWMAIFEPPITVIRQPVYQLGSTATELLIRKIENDQDNLPIRPRIILNTELIIRNSIKI
ncbi:MAG: LacI family DNA-binding transcriptional regulator [Atribacterota bacterium]|nr:LacI family DNA-binding transcriptional regulator [Atribacterota bacterium]MDD5637732.1 LacI family DNA-binding transcriptional regulator [Atribacterota bacterium]